MDDQGVEAAILFPNGIGFASNHVFAIDDEAQRTAVLQTYNDFYLDLQHESDDRLLGQGLLPIWDMDLTVKEMTRLLDAGMRGFTLSDKPEMLGLPELHEPYFEPMWDLFNESGAVPSFHIGSGARKEEMEALRAMRNQPKAQYAAGGAPADPGHAQPVVERVRPAAHAGRRGDADVHEQRPHRHQPVHERPVRPLPERQDRVGRERHRLGAVHPRGARVPARRDGHRPDRGRATSSAGRRSTSATTSS